MYHSTEYFKNQIEHLRAELANAKLELAFMRGHGIVQEIARLRAELAEARRALLAGNDTVLANKKLQEDNAAKDARIAEVVSAFDGMSALCTTLRERIATYWQPMAEAWQRDAETLRKRVAELEENIRTAGFVLASDYDKLVARAERAEAALTAANADLVTVQNALASQHEFHKMTIENCDRLRDDWAAAVVRAERTEAELKTMRGVLEAAADALDQAEMGIDPDADRRLRQYVIQTEKAVRAALAPSPVLIDDLGQVWPEDAPAGREG